MKLLSQITTTREKPFQTGICAGTGEPSVLEELPVWREVRWKGFGGCLNEAGMAALSTLGEETRTRILDEFFLPDRMGLNFCRLPIGANDYALDWYSYDEETDDFRTNLPRTTTIPPVSGREN